MAPRRRPSSTATRGAPGAGPLELGPILALRGSEVRVGTCSWTDPTLVKESDWYPKRSMSAAERLAFYARSFPLVEADSTYYAPPGPALTRSWVERTPPGFLFDVKAYSLFTHHPTRAQSLWPDVRDAARPEFRGKARVYAEHLEPDALEEAWRRFAHALAPLADAGRLGAVLVQYPQWFTPKRSHREEVAALPERLPGIAVSVEFRSPLWLGGENDRQRTLAILREHGLALVVVDAPRASGLDTVVAATRDDLAVVRFHGRADDTWNRRDVTAAERFRYLYDERELSAWVPRVEELAGQADRVQLLMNNCYADYGVRNAADLRQVLMGSGAVVDETSPGDG